MSVRLLTFSFSFSLVVNKQAGFHLIAKSDRLSPRTLIQLQFCLNGLGQGSKSQIWNQFYSKHSVMPFTLSYLQTTGASKTERELLVQTNAFYKQLCYMWRLQLSFTSRSLSTQKLSKDKNERNRFFNSYQEIRILLEFSWPSLLNILESVVCLSQTTTKFVLLAILNHIMFIPYFVNDLTFFFSSGIATFFFFSTDKHFSIVFYSN